MALRRALLRFSSSTFNKSDNPLQNHSDYSWRKLLRSSSSPAHSLSSSPKNPQSNTRSPAPRYGLGFRDLSNGFRVGVLDGDWERMGVDSRWAMWGLMSRRLEVRGLSVAVADCNVGVGSSEGLLRKGGFSLNQVAVQKATHIGYSVVGRLDGGNPVNIEPQEAFAIVQIGSHQFKVTPGDCIYTEKLKFADINDKLRLHRVLLVGTKGQSIIGRPIVPSSAVFAVVEEHALDAKVIIFKKKRRKHYRRTRGHRQELTRLRITNIEGLELSSGSEAELKEAC